MQQRSSSPLRPSALGLLALLLLALPLVALRAEDEAGGDRGALGGAPQRFLGIDDVDPFLPSSVDAGRLALLAGAGDLLVRTRPIPWGRIEPHAPLMPGRQLHDWEGLDAFVAAWTKAGFEVVLVLDPQAAWAAAPDEESRWLKRVRGEVPADVAEILVREATGARVPKAGMWEEWERFVRELTERYDGDGSADGPDLARPVRWIQIVDRPTSPLSWVGSAEEYTRLLHHASQGAAKASAAVRLVHGTVDFQTLGREPFPNDDLLQKRASEGQTAGSAVVFEMTRAMEFSLLTLEMRRLFGAVAHAGSGHLADEAADLTYLAHRLAASEGVHREVWLVDSPLGKLDASELPGSDGPSLEEQRVRAGARTSNSSWLHRGQAYDVVRTVVNARAAGAARVFLGGRARRGKDPLDLFVGGEPAARRPAWYALQQLAGLLRGQQRVTSEWAGRGARAYRVTFSEGADRPWVMVVVRNPDRSWAGNPKEAQESDELALRLESGTYVIESTALTDAAPSRKRVEVSGGTLRLPLSSAPIYVYPDA